MDIAPLIRSSASDVQALMSETSESIFQLGKYYSCKILQKAINEQKQQFQSTVISGIISGYLWHIFVWTFFLNAYSQNCNSYVWTEIIMLYLGLLPLRLTVTGCLESLWLNKGLCMVGWSPGTGKWPYMNKQISCLFAQSTQLKRHFSVIVQHKIVKACANRCPNSKHGEY